MKRLVLLLAANSLAFGLAGCASVSKKCFGDGVCRTESDGKVTWEGPPEKVAEYQAREEAQKKAAAERDAAFASAEKRPASEPIRVAIVGPSVVSQGLQTFALTYRQMFMEAMGGDPRIQLVDAGRIAHLLKDGDSMSSRNDGPPAKVDQKMARRVRDGSGEVDVLVVVTAKEKERTGMVSGGGGVGAAQVVNVEFSASLSSVYTFDEQKKSEIGDSNTGIVMGGYDKTGQHKKAELKGNRDPSKDRAAVTQLAQWVKQTVNGPVGAQLPSLTAVQTINEKMKEQMKTQLQQDPQTQKLMELLQKQKSAQPQ
ncbi:MAG: hypothetical protein AB1938_28690 [Myxococcota bacterium]